MKKTESGKSHATVPLSVGVWTVVGSVATGLVIYSVDSGSPHFNINDQAHQGH